MRNNLTCKNHLEYLCPALIFVVGLCIYSLSISHSGLWYDEAVEYFFSKFPSGNVPGSIGETHNMYERIISTYQPPLYNVLMYVWLIFFDSEFLFRLAGVLTTLVGMLGIYCALMKVSGYKWASLGAVVYQFIPKVVYYAFECGEYNLLLCCEAWTLYFFVRLMNQKDNVSLAGFFLFSCLSVYSQYGAIFFVGGLYITLLLYSMNDKNKLIKILCATFFSVIIAGFPLVYFFLIPQMTRQGSLYTSHYPVFLKDNVLYDFLRGIVINAKWVLLSNGTDSWSEREIIFQIFMVIPFAILSCIFFIAILRNTKKLLIFLLPCLISYLLYCSCVVTAFYGYHGYGSRYSLFLVPIWLPMLIYALYLQVKTCRQKKSIVLLIVMCVAVSGLHCVLSSRIKDNIREVAEAWYDNKGFQDKTLVHKWDDATFQFYIRHNENYDESFQTNIITAEEWICSAIQEDDMLAKLEAMGIFEYDGLFYVSPKSNILDYKLETFTKVMNDAGYKIKSIYEEGISVLLYIYKEN